MKAKAYIFALASLLSSCADPFTMDPQHGSTPYRYWANVSLSDSFLRVSTSQVVPYGKKGTEILTDIQILDAQGQVCGAGQRLRNYQQIRFPNTLFPGAEYTLEISDGQGTAVSKTRIPKPIALDTILLDDFGDGNYRFKAVFSGCKAGGLADISPRFNRKDKPGGDPVRRFDERRITKDGALEVSIPFFSAGNEWDEGMFSGFIYMKYLEAGANYALALKTSIEGPPDNPFVIPANFTGNISGGGAGGVFYGFAETGKIQFDFRNRIAAGPSLQLQDKDGKPFLNTTGFFVRVSPPSRNDIPFRGFAYCDPLSKYPSAQTGLYVFPKAYFLEDGDYTFEYCVPPPSGNGFFICTEKIVNIKGGTGKFVWVVG